MTEQKKVGEPTEAQKELRRKKQDKQSRKPQSKKEAAESSVSYVGHTLDVVGGLLIFGALVGVSIYALAALTSLMGAWALAAMAAGGIAFRMGGEYLINRKKGNTFSLTGGLSNIVGATVGAAA